MGGLVGDHINLQLLKYSPGIQYTQILLIRKTYSGGRGQQVGLMYRESQE